MRASHLKRRHSLSQSELQILDVPVWGFMGSQGRLLSDEWCLTNKHFTTPRVLSHAKTLKDNELKHCIKRTKLILLTCIHTVIVQYIIPALQNEQLLTTTGLNELYFHMIFLNLRLNQQLYLWLQTAHITYTIKHIISTFAAFSTCSFICCDMFSS